MMDFYKKLNGALVSLNGGLRNY